MKLNNIKFNRNNRGFTIVELLVVIVVIGILAAITIVSYTGITNKANTTRAISNASTTQQVVEIMAADNTSYPITVASIMAYAGSSRIPAGITVASPATVTLGSGNGLANVTYSCLSAVAAAAPCLTTGGRIGYYDFAAGSIQYMYVGAALVGSNYFNPAS
jgi:prepilin-type N-terminal cleavage/methylation domain-containing protein